MNFQMTAATVSSRELNRLEEQLDITNMEIHYILENKKNYYNKCIFIINC